MEASTCPECRVPIGGDGHHSVLSNTRVAELEQLAMEYGADFNT